MTRNDLNTAHQDEIVEETTTKRRLAVKKELRTFLYYTAGVVTGVIATAIIVKSGNDETADV
jgi:hypothetical protein